ncbi:MAG TPA: hypothetical protein PLU87_10970 [Sedimentisphaerales bacterium]|nr:hypothetical protein [Sedimentisphaerales bacterium]HRS11612.1 hypothetical protein [Sedimentisphaerales bacterium]HRV48275.1 hypothetical protein [Sedimentisphaerales bacterium]
MILPGSIRRLSAVFRGSVAPPLILLSVMIGFWVGLMPGWSGLHTALVVVVLILNIHIGLFLLSLGVGKAVCLAAAPVLYHVGIYVQDHLSGLLNVLSSIPVVGMTDFSRYALAGALVVGPVIGAIAGLMLAFSVIQFRRMMVKVDEKSEKFRTYYSKTWVRILDWILIGKRTKDVKSMFAKTRYIRKAGIVLAIIVVGAFFAAAHFLQDTTVKNYATQSLTRANGAEVNLGSLGISLTGGSVSAEDLQVTNAQEPTQNQVVVEKVAANASIYDLLLGKVIMENVEVSGVQFNQARQTPGKVLAVPPAEEEPFDPNAYTIDANDVAKVEKYVKDAKKLKEQLEKLRKWLPEGKKGPAEETQPPQSYREYLRAKAATSPTVTMLAKRVLADKVNLPSELFGNSRILMTNLSDAPHALGEPITLELTSHETPAALKAQVDYSSGTPHVTGTFEGFDLSKIQAGLGQDAGIAFESGAASGTFTGQLTRELVDLTFKIDLKNLKAKGQGQGVLGLGAQQTSEVMEVMNELSTTIRVVGPVTSPRVVFDTKGLGEEFKQALVKAGKDRLQKEIDAKLQEQLGDKLGDKVPEQLKDTLKAPGKNIVEGLGGLLGGKKKDEKPQE